MAGRASVELHTLIFFKDQEVIADARVTRVSATHTCSEHCSLTHAPPGLSKPCVAYLGEVSAWASWRASEAIGRSCSLCQLWRPGWCGWITSIYLHMGHLVS